MKVISTAKISERHQREMQTTFSNIDFLFFDDIQHLYKEKTAPFSDVDVLITYGEDLTERNIQDFPKLKWIQVVSAGLERMPLEALNEKGITITNARGIHGIPMSEYTLGVMLQIVRKSLHLYEQQKDSIWDRTIRIDELSNKNVGIVGFGAIGQEIAKRAKAFNMNVYGVNTSGESHPHADMMFSLRDIDHVLTISDFVVIILPLTKETEGIISREKIEKMKSTSWLINIARGSVVDEEYLIEALKHRKIAGAVLDVFKQEPLPNDSPLWKMENVILTPHLSGRSPYYMERALQIFHHNLNCYIDGDEKTNWMNVIHAHKGY